MARSMIDMTIEELEAEGVLIEAERVVLQERSRIIKAELDRKLTIGSTVRKLAAMSDAELTVAGTPADVLAMVQTYRAAHPPTGAPAQAVETDGVPSAEAVGRPQSA